MNDVAELTVKQFIKEFEVAYAAKRYKYNPFLTQLRINHYDIGTIYNYLILTFTHFQEQEIISDFRIKYDKINEKKGFLCITYAAKGQVLQIYSYLIKIKGEN